MRSPELLITDLRARAYKLFHNTVGVVSFVNHINVVNAGDQIMLERYEITQEITPEIIDAIITTRTTTKYPNDGVMIPPQTADDGLFAVTTGTYMWDFNHTSSAETNTIPSIWSIRSLAIDGLAEVLDPDIRLENTYIYRVVWIRDGKGYGSEYVVLDTTEPLDDLMDEEEDDHSIDDGSTDNIGADGNPTLCELGYCGFPGDPDAVDALLEKDNWLDRCAPDSVGISIEANPSINHYGIEDGEWDINCRNHLINRHNYRYRGTCEEAKITAYENQMRYVLNLLNDKVIYFKNMLSTTMNWQP